MLLTITSTHKPAADLGYLLYKHPQQLQSFELTCGMAHVFYPEADDDRCTVALLLDIDPVGLVRKGRGNPADGRALEQYVNDRPYVASSFLSVAIAEVFSSAMAGKSKERPELADTIIPLEAHLPCLPCRGGEMVLRKLFEPLGYTVEAQENALDENFPEWGKSRYYGVKLKAICRLKDLLTHLYVLIPVLDDEKHYWVGDAEIDKLMRHAKEWLPSHPEKDLITSRYLLHRNYLTREALIRLCDDDAIDPDAAEEKHAEEEAVLEKPMSLNEQRTNTVLGVLKQAQVHRLIDLGCGEGKLLKAALDQKQFEYVVGLDVSHRSLEIAHKRLHLEEMNERARKRITLLHGSLTYRDKRMQGFDAATCVEVIEHMDESRLVAFERVLFEFARPKLVVMTTPNSEYNAKFPTLPAGKFRHKDHRFEWSRSEFQEWAGAVASKHGYSVTFLPVGDVDAELGPPTQMGVFSL